MSDILSASGDVKTECLPMTTIYRDKLNDQGEKSRIEKLELFDEFEEWDLL